MNKLVIVRDHTQEGREEKECVAFKTNKKDLDSGILFMLPMSMLVY